MYDVCIIGAGVSGCAVARELARYEGKFCVIEKCEDVCCGTSKANSAIVHAGFDAAQGSLMAKLNVQGNRMMGELAKELDVPFERNGSLVICQDENDLPKLRSLYEKGMANGVADLQILSKEEVRKLEPNLTDRMAGALYAPTGGIVCPFLLTIALAENAADNGVEFWFDSQVNQIRKEDGYFTIETGAGRLESRYIVNAAGVYADRIHNMVSSNTMQITARKGEYCLLDRSAGTHVSHTIFTLPTPMGKGVLVTPTVHGNLLVGPTAADIPDKEGTDTTAAGLAELMQKAGMTVKNLPFRQVITSFAGLRAHLNENEFVIGEAEDVPQFIDVAGIESPGLSSAPAIGVMVADILRDSMGLREKEHFQAKRKGILNPADLSFEERNALIQREPAYGNVICRCESVTEGEIIDAIHRPVGAKSLDGIKRRTRAGMGRCQSGFCSPKVMEILKRELQIRMEDVTKCGGHSVIAAGQTKTGK
ncbi:L-2-hydroxyglutarate dehydrogenase [Eubacterium plexicaudatum ASF492]|uniref:Glycerol-3-phosphate dehydrogenase n=1 Tax=Eubacterium plexicaudatum ASF492 TaxID=1235802 RepID=N2AS10_9FIRM|nr:L-2-hydroxyglutarate dehydrogenase [Eubacterium plexicaudatum ASF492]